MRISVTHQVEIPATHKLELYKKAPEFGPKILFFSGGTALRNTSRELIRYTHNSIHLITPFDSGGSSAVIRKAFGMPAVGDIRNRLLALADQSITGTPEIFKLFTYRLSQSKSQEELHSELQHMATGEHPLVQPIPAPMREIICNHFKHFLKIMPDDFDLNGASVGNLVLAAGYLHNNRQLDPVIYVFSKLVQVYGVVHATINKDLHIAVRLQDDTVIIGQHCITGKEMPPPASPIREIWMTDSLDDSTPVHTAVSDKTKKHIAEADLICYPVGSFFSSVMANLLPDGVGEAVAANRCPKVFVPNTAEDPESLGLSVVDQVRLIRRQLALSGAPNGSDTLKYVLMDMEKASYTYPIDTEELESMGVTVINCPLLAQSGDTYMDARLLAEALLSLS
ncbi:MAG: hypothetical protein CL942_13105 [Desulfovibrio sp.]|nr:hypothetical protein [Desulfovibrio sp.]|tara:strand:+ start:75478 stop:76662 length:1185 start_codon:yes stop_codon:yes gene_type:complete